MRTLMLSPEPPYPLRGGGAYRTASLLHYLGDRSQADLILISESGKPALLPAGLAVNQQVIPLEAHRKDLLSRYLRNARRAIQGVPPLIDRLAGLEPAIEAALQGHRYDLGVIEHFWCAPYIRVLEKYCNRVVLDLHNIESVLHERCATFSPGLVAMGHRRFAATCRELEVELLGRFATVLVTSQDDASAVRNIAPDARIQVYPNAFPLVAQPSPTIRDENLVVFSGNFEYHPNIDAVDFLANDIWPAVKELHPQLRLRLVGRGEKAIARFIRPELEMEATGPVADAFAEIARGAVAIAPLRFGSGTRLKIIEAWAAGCPVLATPLAAEGLLTEDGVNIRIAGSAEGFVTAIDEMLSDPAGRARMAAAGRARYESSYSWEAVWRNLDLIATDEQPRP